MTPNDRLRAYMLRELGVHLTDKECYAIRQHPGQRFTGWNAWLREGVKLGVTAST